VRLFEGATSGGNKELTIRQRQGDARTFWNARSKKMEFTALSKKENEVRARVYEHFPVAARSIPPPWVAIKLASNG